MTTIPDSRKETRTLILRAAITLGLLGLLLWNLDYSDLGTRLASLSLPWIAASVLVVLAAIALSAMKWGLILCTRGFCIGYWRAVRHYFVGLFFNNVLPTTVGGDAVRAWETTKDTGEVPEAVGSVVTERLIAGVALGVTALIGLPFVTVEPRLVFAVLAFLVIDVALVALFVLPKVAETVVGKLLPGHAAGGAITATVAAVRASFADRWLFVRVFVYSIAFQILVALVNACIFRAMAVDVTLAQCIVFTPMIFTVTMLPISLSGLGVREAAYWVFFAQVGVSQAEAVTASLLFFFIVGLTSLPGAPLFVLGRRKSTASTVTGATAQTPSAQEA
ncbi:lysylphosphatidylglycerol synthase transmembrane domain-containing protein [Rhodobacter capsulatus]|uniref:lysylphosphatidylglycerol synthase transmembrane domain-containing protein n=1 Tax=Rhodobacter capsulatus TaxID=1061 RepID=UPI0003D3AB32|nr:lysylphosphatidylglycerol synthase transmembrane domain-containing protein [Rhodobacter capsulatus]ETD87293.1 hypothetical protein U713_16975 [Rhodobacter capsulatus YW2]